ncbi:MAG: S10 family peptidase [Gemmatimonadaceae bacterium]
MQKMPNAFAVPVVTLCRVRARRVALVAALVAAAAPGALAQTRRPAERPDSARAADSARSRGTPSDSAARDSLRPGIRDFLSRVNEPPVATHHVVRLPNGELRYTATTGMLPIRNDSSGVIEGGMFFVAYTRDGVTDPGKRPLLIAFNGGPGSSSVWLHLGAFGPRRVRLMPDGSAPAPPYQVEDNPQTLLDQTDIVFVDPVGTGYSRAARPEFGAKFWGLDEDIAAMGEFIRLYLTRYSRWSSPLFIGGESYGTTRATGLSGYLADRGITLNGIVLLSTVMDFAASSMSRGNAAGFVNFLPSYTATAWYHHRLAPELQAKALEQVMAEAKQWAVTQYGPALAMGDRLPADQRAAIVRQLALYTGLSAQFIADNDMQVTLGRFNHELLRGERRVIGRLDSRFTTYDLDPGSENVQLDPSEATIRNTFTPAWNDYVRRELKYRDDDVYYILGGGIGRWHYPQNNYADVSPSIERAFTKNPYLRLYVAMGYYDMATPYFAVEYTLGQLRVAPEVRSNIVTEYFAAGHMMYIDDAQDVKLRAGIRKFLDGAARQQDQRATGSPAGAPR